jgi:membrane associated rhomboid family serine protease
MFWGAEFQNREPLFWVGGRPIYATALLIIIYCVGMVFAALSKGVGGDGLWLQLIFSSDGFFSGKWWQALTYPLMNQPSLWFGIEMVMLYWFGSELEKYFGRRMFFIFYSILWLVPVWVFVLWGAFVGSVNYHGSGILNFCVFAGFAMIYQRVELIFRIQAIWLATAIGALSILSMLSVKRWPDLIFFTISLTLTWGLLKWNWEGVLQEILNKIKNYKQRKLTPMHSGKKNFARTHRSSSKSSYSQKSPLTACKNNIITNTNHPDESHVDMILDKIAAEGLESLSNEEHELLKRHSAALSKKN